MSRTHHGMTGAEGAGLVMVGILLAALLFYAIVKCCNMCCRVLAAALRQDLAERRNFYLSIGTVFGAMARYLDPSHELGHGRDFVYRARLAVDRI